MITSGSSSIDISVLVCTHNPRPASLTKVLESLRAQTLNLENWELLLIDNASTEVLAGCYELSWHPKARHLREERIGKTNALLRGIAESSGQVLVIVDDDNVLALDYLEKACAIAATHPQLGAWGGNIILQFEEPPPPWTKSYWTFLAQQEVQRDTMVCSTELSGPLPAGAGCCVRRQVAESYAKQVVGSELRRSLGRSGILLTSGEDTDLVLTACELGFSRGLFKTLQLEHLIPPQRLKEDYLLRLVAGIRLSSCILEMIHPPHKPPPAINWWWWLKFCTDCAFKFGRKRRFYIANKRAQRKARAVYEELHFPDPPSAV